MLHPLMCFHIFITASLRKAALQRLTVLLSLSLLMTACVSTDAPVAKKNTPDIFHQDSTVYFADKKASISLRASFIQKTNESTDTTSNTTTQSLMGGYKLQFRSIFKGNSTIGHVSIIAGGRRIVLSDKPLFIQSTKGLTINTSIEDALFIMAYNDATLRFTFNQTSHLMSINNHTLSEFIIP